MTTLLPRDVPLWWPCPFTDMLGRTEREQGVAVLVLGCTLRNEWGTITMADVKEVVDVVRKDDVDVHAFFRNPFCRPDIDWLVAEGLATIAEDRRSFAPTPALVERIDAWMAKMRERGHLR